VTYSHLTGRANAAHIHKGAPGAAGPVVLPLFGPCHNGQTGTVKISKAVVAELEGHRAYVNVHTATRIRRASYPVVSAEKAGTTNPVGG
jgi:hypothetical protein